LWKIWKDDFCLNRILRPYRVCHVSIYETYISQMKNIQEFRNCLQTALEFENRSWIECLETHHPKWFQTYWETKESRYFINECLTDFEIYEFLQNKVGGFEMTDEFFLNFLTFPLEKSKIRIMDSIWKRHLSYRPCLDSLIQNENLYVFLTWTTEELEYLCQHVPFSFSFTLTLGPYLASEGHDRAIQWIIKTFSLESHLDLFIIPHSMSLLNSSIFQWEDVTQMQWWLSLFQLEKCSYVHWVDQCLIRSADIGSRPMMLALLSIFPQRYRLIPNGF